MKIEIASTLEKIVVIIKAQPMADLYYSYRVLNGKVGGGKRPLNFDRFCELFEEKKTIFEERFELFMLTPNKLKSIKEFGNLTKEEKEQYREIVELKMKIDKDKAYQKYISWISEKEEEEDNKYSNLGLDVEKTVKVKIIMEDEREYPYKTDKVKALFGLGLEDVQIIQITQLSSKFACTSSYIKGIIAKEMDKNKEKLQQTANNSNK